jgi:hypothetical protein
MQNFYFYTFYCFIFYFLLFFWGWAQLNPHGLGWAVPSRPGPARSLAQASDPAGPHEARVNQITRA